MLGRNSYSEDGDALPREVVALSLKTFKARFEGILCSLI